MASDKMLALASASMLAAVLDANIAHLYFHRQIERRCRAAPELTTWDFHDSAEATLGRGRKVVVRGRPGSD